MSVSSNWRYPASSRGKQKEIGVHSPRGHAWISGKEGILTDSMENPHFICIRLGDVQDHLVLSKDSAGTLSPQQHDGHVLKVYGAEEDGKRGERSYKWETPR